jgi:hypothetical protein
MEKDRVAIVGAGLTGLSLALALQKQSIPCILYELRPHLLDIGGTVTLSPNALWILDTLGIYERIKENGHEWEVMYFKSQQDELVGSIEYGSKSKFGYRALRIYRHFLITALLDVAAEKKYPYSLAKNLAGSFPSHPRKSSMNLRMVLLRKVQAWWAQMASTHAFKIPLPRAGTAIYKYCRGHCNCADKSGDNS